MSHEFILGALIGAMLVVFGSCGAVGLILIVGSTRERRAREAARVLEEHCRE